MVINAFTKKDIHDGSFSTGKVIRTCPKTAQNTIFQGKAGNPAKKMVFLPDKRCRYFTA
jgi:hypothetical protein